MTSPGLSQYDVSLIAAGPSRGANRCYTTVGAGKDWPVRT